MFNFKAMSLFAASLFSSHALAQNSSIGIRPDYYLLQFGQSGNVYFAASGYGASTDPILLINGNKRIACLLNEIGSRIRAQGVGNVFVNCRLEYTAEMVAGDFGNSYKNTVQDIDFGGCIKYNTQGEKEPLVQNLPTSCSQ